jgi:hypothetical protein
MNRIFKIDRPFVKELHKRLERLRKQYLGHLSASKDTPNVEQLEELISTIIWASTQHEEGRLSRFAVAFAKPSLLDFLALSFEVPKRLSTEELRKLAPAVLPRDGRVMVWPNTATNVLEICGVQTTSLSSVTFRVLDPGRLTVSFPLDSTIAEITGTRAGFISSDWNNKGQRMMAPPGGSTGGAFGELLSFFSIHETQQILSRIRLLGHGGTIVFVQDNLAWQKSVDRPIFYGCNQNLNELDRIVESFRREVEATPGGTSSDTMKKGLELIASTPYQHFIGEAARSIAYLSSVDGATILNSKFSVLAFGAKLKPKKKTKSDKVEMVTRVFPFEGVIASDVPIDEEFRGTRHLSAARFVLNNPKSVAFVVSQDGGITGLIMEARSSTLFAFKSLELLL